MRPTKGIFARAPTPTRVAGHADEFVAPQLAQACGSMLANHPRCPSPRALSNCPTPRNTCVPQSARSCMADLLATYRFVPSPARRRFLLVDSRAESACGTWARKRVTLESTTTTHSAA